jgi:hypothetical protein
MIRRKIHERVLNAVSVDELEDAYAQWADSYDNDLQGEMGYKAPVMVSRLLRVSCRRMQLGSLMLVVARVW